MPAYQRLGKDNQLQSNNQFFVFVQLSTLGIEMTDILEKENCSECYISLLSLTQNIIETFANIYL